MDRCQNFAQSLEAIRKQRCETVTEFSEELDVSKSTMQGVLKNGNTTLHTALHIAGQLGVPLSALTGELVPTEKLSPMIAMLNYFGWFQSLRAEDQRAVSAHIQAIMEVLKK